MELIIFIGLQASGKTTFFQKYFATTHQHISKDLMRNNKNRSIRQTQLIQEALHAGRSVVVDNTNPTVEDRALLIELGNSYGVQIIGYYFESKVNDCLERNQQRSGKAKVPDVGLYAIRKKLVRPSYTEGFHKLFYVRIAHNSTFNISAWTEGKIPVGSQHNIPFPLDGRVGVQEENPANKGVNPLRYTKAFDRGQGRQGG